MNRPKDFKKIERRIQKMLEVIMNRLTLTDQMRRRETKQQQVRSSTKIKAMPIKQINQNLMAESLTKKMSQIFTMTKS